MGILVYLKVTILIAAMSIGAAGAWYVQGIRLDKAKAANVLLTRQLEGYKRALKIMKEDLKIDQHTQTEKERIDGLGHDDLIREFERMRSKVRDGKHRDTDEADD